jgi:translation elongation factor EF-G
MVDNVGIDDAVEEVLANEAEIAVNGGQSALDEGPAIGLEVVDLGVRVVQVGDGNCQVVMLAHRTHETRYRENGESVPSQ